ncbi:MAG: FliA/WhiG family RNA polymerase sigma factor [Oligoflexia bacterium]|nr:FliA/WhiG family RNA polymerase sigma factor [Oligoflexia bacterium]
MSSNLLRKYKEEPNKLTPQQKDKLILEFAPLIKFIAQKIAVRLPSNIELDDLISSGVIGLMDAIEKYDPTRDNKFKTYAEFRIRGAILDELRAQDWVPRSVRDKAKLLDRTYSSLEQAKGRSATDEEVAAELKMTMEEFYDLVNQVRPVSLLSIDDSNTFSNVDKKSILNILESCRINSPFNQLNLKSVKEIVAKAIEELPEKQRLVLSLYYYEDLNLKEIGRILDVTESRVSQLHAQAVTRLRSKLSVQLEESDGSSDAP